MEFSIFLKLFSNFNLSKKLYYFLNYFFGFNLSFSYYICIKQGFSPFIQLNHLNNKDLYLLFLEFNYFYCYFLELNNLKKLKIDFLKQIFSFKGYCHSFFLPVRGQRTKNNSKTRKKYHIV